MLREKVIFDVKQKWWKFSETSPRSNISREAIAFFLCALSRCVIPWHDIICKCCLPYAIGGNGLSLLSASRVGVVYFSNILERYKRKQPYFHTATHGCNPRYRKATVGVNIEYCKYTLYIDFQHRTTMNIYYTTQPPLYLTTCICKNSTMVVRCKL